MRGAARTPRGSGDGCARRERERTHTRRGVEPDRARSSGPCDPPDRNDSLPFAGGASADVGVPASVTPTAAPGRLFPGRVRADAPVTGRRRGVESQREVAATMNVPRHRRSDPRRKPAPGRRSAPEIHFCDNCQVSVPMVDLERGTARRTPRGRVFCSLCVRATPAERRARRRILETEFADAAPIAAPDAVPPPLPNRTPPRSDTAKLVERIEHLERAVADLRAALLRLERRPQE